MALSTLLQVAVAATLVGYLTAGATPVWLLAQAERVYATASATGPDPAAGR